MSESTVARGQLHALLVKPQLLKRYLGCILVGVPIWFVIGILITFAPELSRELGVVGLVTGSKAIMWAYVGLSAGDLASGLVSQWLRSRKKAVLLFLSLTLSLTVLYSQAAGWSEFSFYALCAALGFGTGYWAMFVTIAAEQFGTNVRASAATSIPNFVRGSVVPMTAAFQFLRQDNGLINSALILGMVTLVIAALSVHLLDETFSKDLNYFEEL
jgi:putative MFS transporter